MATGASTSSKIHRDDDALDTELHAIQPQSPIDVTSNPALVPTLNLPPSKPPNRHSAAAPQPQQPSAIHQSSLEAWIDQALLAPESFVANQTPKHCDGPDNRLKRKRVSSTSTSTGPTDFLPTIPLTRKALKQHLASTMSSDSSTLADNVFTPSLNPSTPESSLQTPSIASKPSLAHNDVRGYMEQHRMLVEKHMLDRPDMASFRELVMRVADTERPSGRKPGSEKRWQKYTEHLELHNEATMLDYILPHLIKVNRQVPVKDPFAQQDPRTHQDPLTHQQSSIPQASTAHQASSVQAPVDDMLEDFVDSGLAWNVDREFKRTYLPNSYASFVNYEDKIATALAKERGMKNPKPDRTYGLAVNNIPHPGQALLRDETNALLNAIPGLQHVFFLIEGVSSSGSLAKAINQACRGGTVAIYIQRLILAAIGQLRTDEGPDRQTYVYTATINDSSMSFYVNFAHTRGQNVSYYMEHIYTYALRSKDALLYLRRVCHNILDWGVRTRRSMLDARCTKMYEYDWLAIEKDAAKLREAQAAETAAAAAQGQKGKKRKTGPGIVHQGAS
ncbi:MAG: hypothetical protein Q9170_008355 [Blastenia crenularia]